MDLASIVKTIAPALGSALPLPPPLGALAARWLADKVLGKPDAKTDEIAEALANPNPEIMLKLKEADNAFKTHMADLGVDLEKIAAGDRASAREMQMQTRSWMPPILAGVAVVAFVVCILLAFFVDLPDKRANLVFYLLGVLTLLVKDVYHFNFGTTAGSQKKDEQITHMWDTSP